MSGRMPPDRRSGWLVRRSSRAAWVDALDGDRWKIELVGLCECQDRDREVLDRETGGGEERDVPIGEPTVRLADQHLAELCDISTSEQPRLHGLSQFATVAGLFPVVTKQAPAPLPGCYFCFALLPAVEKHAAMAERCS